jgi:NitT/TauT family transport system ATP-binding protein
LNGCETLKPLLRLINISKTFNSVKDQKVEAIEEISLDLFEGEFLSILGPSGCGKTTLLRMIAGLETATRGKIFLENDLTHGTNPKVGLIFQEFVLLPWRTVIGNIEFGLENMGMNKKERRQKTMEYIKIIELEGFEYKYPKELSGGMKQRVAIARAIICNPSILLMDEPFASLDAQTRFNMQKFLLRLWEREKKTIVFVTHNVDEAVFLGQRLITMSSRPGKILSETMVNQGYPRDINSPEFIRIRKEALQQLENN